MNTRSIELNSVFKSLLLATDSPTELLSLHYKNAIECGKPYSGDWCFPWLLSSWESYVWKTTNGKKTRKNADGHWIDTANIYWDVLLPDGKRLTDPSYKDLLETCRKLSALHRSGFATRNPPSVSDNVGFTGDLLSLCNWLVLHKSRYHPADNGLKILDQSGIKQIILSIAKGGWCEANRLVERCLTQLYSHVFDQEIPDEFLRSPTNLPNEICQKIIDWLKLNNGFSLHGNVATNKVSRKFLAQLVSTDKSGLFGHDFLDVVIRQFETELKDEFILKAGYLLTEYPSHRTRLLCQIEDEAKSDGLVRQVSRSFRNILTLYRHLPDELPSPTRINLTEVLHIGLARSSGDGHTPFIPIDTGLKYLNSAMKWVLLYGDALIEYFLLIEEKFISAKNAAANPETFRCTAKSFQKKLFETSPLPKALSDAGFKFTSYCIPFKGRQDFSSRRANPSLEEAIKILVGAVTITIGLLKPSRQLELSSLPLDCLSRSPQGLYWLESSLAKRTQGEMRSSIKKPIPYITAKAIQQMYKLNRGLVRIYNEEDSYKSRLLFYLPNFKKSGFAVKMQSTTLNKYLDAFCDHVGLPPDEYGRRWYLRIHEMRKWFLLLLFWSGRYDVLDGARWIAGHTDVKHLYEYIEREFPGAQLGILEAECAVDQLAKYEETKVLLDGESIGLTQLYDRVLNHFRVNSLSLVKESEWHLLVEELFEDEFHLEPYSIRNDDGTDRVCVAVRSGPRKVREK